MLLVNTCKINFKSMHTLTYPEIYPATGTECKKHCRHWRTSMAKRFGAFEYLWWFEFQKRGAPHFHVLTTLGDSNPERRKHAARLWAKAAKVHQDDFDKVVAVHSHSKAWEPLIHPDGGRRYVNKYITKMRQKEVPDDFEVVGRWWGNSRGVKVPDPDAMGVITEDVLREFLACEYHPVADSDVLPKVIINIKNKNFLSGK